MRSQRSLGAGPASPFLGGLNGPGPPKKILENVGFAPDLFPVSVWEGTASQTDDFRPGPARISNWVPEGSLARVCWCHEMALELVCGAVFWCNRHCRTSPVVLEGFWGQVWPKINRKPTRKFPARLPSGTQSCVCPATRPSQSRPTKKNTKSKI